MTREILDALRSAEGRLAALKAYQRTHPGIEPPLLKQTQAVVRSLTTQLAEQAPQEKIPMTNIPVMREYLAKVQEEMRTIDRSVGNRPMSKQEQARWTELDTDAKEVEDNIKTALAQEGRAERLAEQRKRWGAVSVGGGSDDGTVSPDAALRMDGAQARDAALRMLDSTSAAHLDDAQREHLEKTIRGEHQAITDPRSVDTDAMNRHIVLTNTDDYRSAFRKLTGPKVSSIVTLSERETAAMAAVHRSSMAEGSGGTGGYMVPSFLDPTIALNAQGSANPIRRLASNETITTKQWKGVGTQGITWAFVGEGVASTDGSPTVSQPTIDVHTARAWITYSIELEQDAVALDAQLFRLLGNGWEETVAGVLATGSGSGAPKGVITALDAIPASEVTITAAGALASVDISKAWVSLPDRARENAAWVMHESVREAVASWGDEYGNRSVDLGGRLKTLRGRPVHSTDQFPAIATTTGSTNQVVVGDFSGYMIVQRAGMTVEPVQTVVNGDGFPVGKRGLFAWARIGADVVDPGLLRLLQQ